jgi:hypothetical protein
MNAVSTRSAASVTEAQRATALVWVSRGFPVVPCSRTDKRALAPGFGRDATAEQLGQFSDPETVGAWWSHRYARRILRPPREADAAAGPVQRVPCSRTDKRALAPGFGRDATAEQLGQSSDPETVGAWWADRYARRFLRPPREADAAAGPVQPGSGHGRPSTHPSRTAPGSPAAPGTRAGGRAEGGAEASGQRGGTRDGPRARAARGWMRTGSAARAVRRRAEARPGPARGYMPATDASAMIANIRTRTPAMIRFLVLVFTLRD